MITRADYNTNYEPKVLQLVYSMDVENCAISCQILEGMDAPKGLKVRTIQPVVDFYQTMIEGLLSIGNEGALEKAEQLVQKATILNNLVLTLLG